MARLDGWTLGELGMPGCDRCHHVSAHLIKWYHPIIKLDLWLCLHDSKPHAEAMRDQGWLRLEAA